MKRPTDLILKLEHQFTLYLQRCEVTRGSLPPDQLREMRRAFYGGSGQMFFLMTQDVMELKNDRTRGQVFDSFVAQLKAFWNEELEKNERGEDEVHATVPVRCACGWHGEVHELKKPEAGGSGLCACPKCGSLELFYPSW